MASSSQSSLPYWQVNVPPAERTEACPDFLLGANVKDRTILSTPDDQYSRQSWAEVRECIRTNRIDIFQRVPSDLRRYLAYNWQLKQKYGSVMQFVVAERLKWPEPIVAAAPPFQSEADIKILWNDWPYGIHEKIVHLVVWTKFDLKDDPVTDDLTPEARKDIDAYVDETFCTSVKQENVSVKLAAFLNARADGR